MGPDHLKRIGLYHPCVSESLSEDIQSIHIAHDSYQINITSIDAEHDRSMREVYGLDKSLRE